MLYIVLSCPFPVFISGFLSCVSNPSLPLQTHCGVTGFTGLVSLSWTPVLLSSKHQRLIIALPPYAASCCCLIAFCGCRGFNKLLYLFVTMQTPLALTATLFNFLTRYLLGWKDGGGRGGGRGHRDNREQPNLLLHSQLFIVSLCVCTAAV